MYYSRQSYNQLTQPSLISKGKQLITPPQNHINSWLTQSHNHLKPSSTDKKTPFHPASKRYHKHCYIYVSIASDRKFITTIYLYMYMFMIVENLLSWICGLYIYIICLFVCDFISLHYQILCNKICSIEIKFTTPLKCQEFFVWRNPIGIAHSDSTIRLNFIFDFINMNKIWRGT